MGHSIVWGGIDMSVSGWFLWGVILILQNFAFTFVSRARNSGSLKRHLIAGFFSNGVWFVSQLFIFSKMFDILTGKYGILSAVATGLFYTGLTLTGSLLAHFWALHSEKGASAVGSNKKYAQIPVDEWNQIKEKVLSQGQFKLM
jgi:hypothetical protein